MIAGRPSASTRQPRGAADADAAEVARPLHRVVQLAGEVGDVRRFLLVWQELGSA
jgi:hypothetical protein